MTFVLFMSAALAAQPDGLDLEDPTVWETGADMLLDGPPGCWEVVGRASWNYDLGRFASSRGDSVFAARLKDGVWSDFFVDSTGEMLRVGRKGAEERVFVDKQRFVPLLGRISDASMPESWNEDDEKKGDGGAEVRVDTDGDGYTDRNDAAVNIVREILDNLDNNVDYSYAQWNDPRQAVVLVKAIPMGKGSNAPEAEVEAVFPGGGRLPSELTVSFPEKFMVGDFPARAKVVDAQIMARGQVVQGAVFPEAETYSFGLAVFGFRFNVAQTIDYQTVRACDGSAEDS